MAKRVFFSFHYENVSNFRVNVVRNHWLTKPNRESAGFFDASVWEKAKKESDLALKKLINKAIYNTSNTCVLIGNDTYSRRWVRYEIFKSLASGNHLFAVHINRIKDRYGLTKINGYNPLDHTGLLYSEDGNFVSPIEYKNNKWIYCEDFPKYKLKKTIDKNKRGKSFTLSEMYKTYCWIKDDGYNNFSSWTK